MSAPLTVEELQRQLPRLALATGVCWTLLGLVRVGKVVASYETHGTDLFGIVPVTEFVVIGSAIMLMVLGPLALKRYIWAAYIGTVAAFVRLLMTLPKATEAGSATEALRSFVLPAIAVGLGYQLCALLNELRRARAELGKIPNV